MSEGHEGNREDDQPVETTEWDNMEPEGGETQEEAVDITPEVTTILGNLRQIHMALSAIASMRRSVVSYNLPIIGKSLRSDMSLDEMRQVLADAGRAEDDILWTDPNEEKEGAPEAIDVTDDIEHADNLPAAQIPEVLRRKSQEHGGVVVSMTRDGVVLRSDMTEDEVFKALYGIDKGTYMKEVTRINDIFYFGRSERE